MGSIQGIDVLMKVGFLVSRVSPRLVAATMVMVLLVPLMLVAANIPQTTATSYCECSSDYDCEHLYGAGYTCDGCYCVVDTGWEEHPTGCHDDWDCPLGCSCVHGECVCYPTGCHSDYDCPPGYTCVYGDCVYYPQYYEYETTRQVVDKVSAYVRILSESGEEKKGIGSFQIKWDDGSEVQTLTSGKPYEAILHGGTCYQKYLGSTTGYVQYQGEECENVNRQHEVKLSLPIGPPGLPDDNACPTGNDRCFRDPGNVDIRYYFVSDPVQYKADGETAYFDFKIQYRWSFDTVDQNYNPIDLTSNGFGFHKSYVYDPFASGSEFLNEGTQLQLEFVRTVKFAEVFPDDTRYRDDHIDIWDVADVARKFGFRDTATIKMDKPYRTVAVWQRQYYLTVNGECLPTTGGPFTCGNPTGTGYYDEGATATFSVDQEVRDFSWMGTMGGVYGFDQWRGDSASRLPTDTITMDSAKQVTAIYTYDDTIAIRNIAILVSAGVIPPAVLISVREWRRRQPRRPAPQ